MKEVARLQEADLMTQGVRFMRPFNLSVFFRVRGLVCPAEVGSKAQEPEAIGFVQPKF